MKACIYTFCRSHTRLQGRGSNAFLAEHARKRRGAPRLAALMTPMRPSRIVNTATGQERQMIAFAATALLVALNLASAQPTSRTDERRFDFGSFDTISSSGLEKVTVVNGKDFSAVARGEPAVLRSLLIEKRGRTLYLSRRPGYYQDKGIAVTVTSPTVSHVLLGGSSSIHLQTITGPRFAADLRGTGDIDVDRISVDEAVVRISGTGAFHAKGATQALDLQVSGPGNVDVASLLSRALNLMLSGSARVRARTSGPARIIVSGDGLADVVGTSACRFIGSGAGTAFCDGKPLPRIE